MLASSSQLDVLDLQVKLGLISQALPVMKRAKRKRRAATLTYLQTEGHVTFKTKHEIFSSLW